MYSNQKPNSEKEYKHNLKTKKPIIAFDNKDECDACKNVAGKNVAADFEICLVGA